MEDTFFYQTLLEKIALDWETLPDKPEETPELTLRALWHRAAGVPVSITEAREMQLPEITEESRQSLIELIAQRLAGQPLSYLTGRQTFMGISMLSNPSAMIPRHETEILGRAAVETALALTRERGSIRVVDLCTGSGNLALTLAKLVPQAKVIGLDLSPDAVNLAKQNAAHLNLTSRTDFLCGDLFSSIDTSEFWGTFDLITCNPPYISSTQVDHLPNEIRGYEPRLAFDGGPFGVRVLSRLIGESPRFLKPDSYLCFEVGLGQGPVLERMLLRGGVYDAIEFFHDEHGEIRVLKALSTIIRAKGSQ